MNGEKTNSPDITFLYHFDCQGSVFLDNTKLWVFIFRRPVIFLLEAAANKFMKSEFYDTP